MDLPCRMIVVVGCASGGTSATTGTLTKNGYYNRGAKSTVFETSCVAKICRCSALFGPPSRATTPEDILEAAQYFYDYKAEAIANGFNRAVVKMPWSPLWEPEILGPNPLGVKVDPLLVYRDVDSHVMSMKKRLMGGKDPESLSRRGQDRILVLHDTLGWPMFVFGRSSSHADLERAVGHPLPVRHFDPARVKF